MNVCNKLTNFNIVLYLWETSIETMGWYPHTPFRRIQGFAKVAIFVDDSRRRSARERRTKWGSRWSEWDWSMSAWKSWSHWHSPWIHGHVHMRSAWNWNSTWSHWDWLPWLQSHLMPSPWNCIGCLGASSSATICRKGDGPSSEGFLITIAPDPYKNFI